MKNKYILIAGYSAALVSLMLFFAEIRTDRTSIAFACLFLAVLLSRFISAYVIKDIKEHVIVNRDFWLRSIRFYAIINVPVYLIRRKYLVTPTH